MTGANEEGVLVIWMVHQGNIVIIHGCDILIVWTIVIK